MNKRQGKKDQFEIIWVSRCRDVKSFGQYFTHMNWLALPPEEALGQRGQVLGDLFKTKGIPHLVLLDEPKSCQRMFCGGGSCLCFGHTGR